MRYHVDLYLYCILVLCCIMRDKLDVDRLDLSQSGGSLSFRLRVHQHVHSVGRKMHSVYEILFVNNFSMNSESRLKSFESYLQDNICQD